MSEHPKVAIFEDDDTIADKLARNLGYLGILVQAIARNVDEAIIVIPTLEAVGVTHVFLDGNLGGHSQIVDTPYESDGHFLAHLIQTQASSIQTIGYSSDVQPYVDIPMGKDGYSIQAVKEILGLEPRS